MEDSDPRVDAIREAIQIVLAAGLELETRAGQTALDYVLRQPAASRIPPTGQFDAPSDTEESPSWRASQWLGVEEERLLDSFEFGDAGVIPTIWHRNLPRQKADKQRTLALMKLLLDRAAFERDDVPARDINEVCEKYECLDQNLPANIQTKGWVSRRGNRGSYVYRLTLAGQDEAKRVLSQVLGTEGD